MAEEEEEEPLFTYIQYINFLALFYFYSAIDSVIILLLIC